MDSGVKPINDRVFLAQFENQTLDKAYFNHLGHLRLAWLYLNSHDVDTAVTLVCSGIQAYAESLGATKKFHLTITDSIVRIMANRIDSMKEKSWQLFLEGNTDLVEDSLSVLNQYFSKDKLLSEDARVSLISPDIKRI